MRLRDVDELIAAHEALTGGGPGKPAKKQGAAITRAGIVLLAAAWEAFVEDHFEEAAPRILGGLGGDQDKKRFFAQTSKRLNNAKVEKVEFLYFNLGLTWVLNGISWQKFSNKILRSEIDELVEARNSIGHGGKKAHRLNELRRWKNMIETLAKKFDTKVMAAIPPAP
jgi:hypothetical protein